MTKEDKYTLISKVEYLMNDDKKDAERFIELNPTCKDERLKMLNIELSTLLEVLNIIQEMPTVE